MAAPRRDPRVEDQSLLLLAGTFSFAARARWSHGTHLSRVFNYGLDGAIAQMLAAGILDIRTTSVWMAHALFIRLCLRLLRAARRVAATFRTPDGGGANLGWFAVFYGLDWVATVPPTVRLTTEAFGRENTGVVYGWIGASHQLGASLAAFGAGAIRTELGDYRLAFLISGTLCLLAGLSFLAIGRGALGRRTPVLGAA